MRAALAAAPLAVPLAILAAMLAIEPARAVSGGDLDVLPMGRYVCELPGDAGDPGIGAGRHQPELDFEVVGDSSYRVGAQRGVYLLTGDELVMTGGPHAGRRFRRDGGTFLRAVDAAGTDTGLRCISSVQAIGIEPPEGRRCKAQRQDRALARGKASLEGSSPEESC